jgi:predicted HTH transcriptional regulator
MFRLIRIGEQIGSGIPKVISSWKNQHWQLPEFKELVQPGFHTILTLKMTDYLPQEVMSHLQEHLGEKFQRLSADERIILALSSLEHGVDHAYLANYLSCHPADLSKMLQRLTRQKLLNSTRGRYAIYTLPMIGDNSSSIGDNDSKIEPKAPLIGDKNTPLIGDKNSSIEDNNQSIRDSLGRTIDTSLQHHVYLVEQLEDLTPAYKKELLSIAQPAREKTRLSAVNMEKIILSICSQQYVSLSTLSELLNRREDSLRQQYLSGLLKKKALLLAYPHHRRHKKQAYCTAPQQI